MVAYGAVVSKYYAYGVKNKQTTSKILNVSNIRDRDNSDSSIRLDFRPFNLSETAICKCYWLYGSHHFGFCVSMESS